MLIFKINAYFSGDIVLIVRYVLKILEVKQRRYYIFIYDGYGGEKNSFNQQLNIKLTEEDMQKIKEINAKFFENEASSSMLGRILVRKGIAFYDDFISKTSG